VSNFNQESYDRAVARQELALTDLEELAQQVDDGEIDAATAAGLRSGYEAELGAAEAELARLGPPPTPKKSPGQGSTKRAPSEKGQPARKSSDLNTRLLVGAGILIVALVVILISVQNSAQPDPAAVGTQVTTASGEDPCAELADALTSHADNGFRLALADCYADVGNAMSAIEHYRTVADAEGATDGEVARANVGLGFLNLQIGELTKAADYMRVALERDAANIEAQYFLGMMLVYDLGDPAAGAPYLESVLATPDLPETVVLEIQAALDVAAGEGS
jgi:tetratricopeptide (TPR) repeat protein